MKFLPVNDVQRNSIDFDLGNVLATTAAVAHAPCLWLWLIFMLLSEGAVAASMMPVQVDIQTDAIGCTERLHGCTTAHIVLKFGDLTIAAEIPRKIL